MSTGTCNNCQQPLTGKYCAACGQDVHIGRLDMHSLLHEAWHGLTHTDKGILLLIHDLFLSPGKTYTAYFAGARKKYFSPVVFFLLSFGVLLLVNKWVFDFEDYRYGTRNEFGRYYEQAAKFKALLLLPVQVLLTGCFFFRRYNLAQVIVFWLYGVAFLNIVAIVLSPFRFAFVYHHGSVETIISWVQYGVIGVHLMAVFGNSRQNRLLVLAAIVLLLLADEYSRYYILNEMGITDTYPTIWQAFKGFFSFD